MNVQAKFQAIRKSLKSSLIEMEDVADVLVNATIGRHHTVQIGPPGMAKSKIVEYLTQCIDGANIFKYLMSMFTTPGEILGQLDMVAMKNGVEQYKTKNKLPEAEIVFLDEIFKANSAVLNSLLSLANERYVCLGGERIHTPTWSIHSASNELPDDASAQAFNDRFLYYVHVDDIKSDVNFERYMTACNSGFFDRWNPPVTVTFEEIKQANEEAMKVSFDKTAMNKLRDLRINLQGSRINVSPRRWRHAIEALKVYAWLDGSDEVHMQHFDILKHILWQEMRYKDLVWHKVSEISGYTKQRIVELTNNARNIANFIGKLDEVDEIQKRLNEMDEITSDLKLLSHHPEAEGALREVKQLRENDVYRHLVAVRNM